MSWLPAMNPYLKALSVEFVDLEFSDITVQE
jgi:hypothetical protein